MMRRLTARMPGLVACLDFEDSGKDTFRAVAGLGSTRIFPRPEVVGQRGVKGAQASPNVEKPAPGND
jgi:hypothetical protein